MITFAVTARGYSLVTLAFLLLVVVAAQLDEAPSRRRWAAFAVVAALGLWTIPVMLFPLGAVAGWLALSFARRRAFAELRALAITLLATVALTALCYAPVLAYSGLAALVRNEYVVPSSWPAFGAELARTAASTLWLWRQGIPTPLAWALAACAVVALARHARVSARPVGLPHAAALWCAVLLLAMHRAPPERVWQWLVPLVAGLAGAGLVYAIERSPRLVAQLPRRLPALAVVLAVVNAAALLASAY
jgi:hypothetical protein